MNIDEGDTSERSVEYPQSKLQNEVKNSYNVQDKKIKGTVQSEIKNKEIQSKVKDEVTNTDNVKCDGIKGTVQIEVKNKEIQSKIKDDVRKTGLVQDKEIQDKSQDNIKESRKLKKRNSRSATVPENDELSMKLKVVKKETESERSIKSRSVIIK